MKTALKIPVSRFQPQRFIIAAAFWLFAWCPPASYGEVVGHPLISSYSGTETGLHTATYSVAQDDRGVLYFAGTSLLIHDGDHWKTSPIPDSFAIRSLHLGPDGRLWAGTMGDLGWFERSATSELVFKPLRAFLPKEDANIGDVWGVQADEKGATFISTTHVLRWDGARFTTWKKNGGKYFHLRSNGKLFVHSAKEGLYELPPSGPRLVIAPEKIGDTGIAWLERRDEDWLVGTSKGIFRYDGHTLEHFAPDLLEFLDTGRLSCAVRLPDGRIVVGTLRNGLAFLRADGSVESILNDPDRIPSLAINSLFVCRDGDLWVTTGSHILRIDINSRSSVFDTRSGLPRQTYRKIAKVNDRIFVVNESGTYVLGENGGQFTAIDSLRGRWQHIRGTSEGLFVSGFRGAFQWNGSELLNLYDTKFDVTTTAPTSRVAGGMLLAHQLSIILRSPSGGQQTLVDNLPDPTHSIAEDLDGRLWIGTLARGLFVATPEEDRTVEPFNTAGAYGLPKLLGPTHVRITRVGTILVFAHNGAWQKRRGLNRFEPIARFPGRNLAAVSEITETGHIWIAHENTSLSAPCVGRVSALESQATWEPHTIDGLVDVGSPRSIYADATRPNETVLWIGGTHALLRHVVRGNLSVVAPRPPILEAFTRDALGDELKPIQGALPYSTGHVEFDVAAPEFSRRSLLRIETRIDGIDHDWRPLEPGSRRALTAIRDGHYSVRARVVAETGATSEETMFSFQVLPPFWRKPPFMVAAGLLLLPFGYGVYVLRIRTLRRRNAELEQKVRERTEELVAANAAKTQFVANMSHDIRNPLNGIVGLALALEDTRLAPRQREIVATLRECTTYLSSLVDDVLDFASIEAGRVELRPRAYSAAELLRSIVETLKADATSSGAVLTVETDPGLPENLFGDAGRIQQILVNFVSNALKYAGGNIQLSAYAPPQAPGEIEFAVTDQGPGISTDDQATLFTKFSRLRQKQGGEEIPGTGLGLASCRLLADIMGGSVGLQSQPGKGSRFTLRLPLTIPSEPDVAPAARLPNTAVLLVEDTDYNAWAASAVLSRLGLTCERARTGAEALQRFGEKRFNVVLLDRNLPDMDGTEVARRMREMESDGLQAVLLAVTAYCTAEDRELCLKSGMDAFVGKPITPEKLRRVLIAAGRRLLASASVQALPETSAVEIDTSLLSYLSDGSPEGLRTQCNQFIATLDQFEAEMSAAAGDNNPERVRVAAHRLLGQAKMVGAETLAEIALAIETAATANNLATCRDLLPRSRAEIISITEAMSHVRPASQSA